MFSRPNQTYQVSATITIATSIAAAPSSRGSKVSRISASETDAPAIASPASRPSPPLSRKEEPCENVHEA
jgi:hypothetical protein